MAIRFRRSVKILPGVRMNFSGSGVGLSVGVPGARVTVGPTGVYRHLSVPGTGIYSRQRVRLDGGGAGGGRGARGGGAGGGGTQSFDGIPALYYRISTEDPTLALLDEHTQEPLAPAAARWVRSNYGHLLQQALEESAEEFNAALEAMEGIHRNTPAPEPAAQFSMTPYEPQRPEPPVEQEVRGLGRLIPGARQRQQDAHARAMAIWQEAHEAWERDARAHVEAEAPLQRAFMMRDRDEEAASTVLSYRFGGVTWPRETLLDWDLKGSTLFLDVDLPLQDTVPKRRYRVLQRGLRLGVTELSDTQVRKAYMQYVHGALFRAVGEAFHALPALGTVVVSGFTQEADPATGAEQDTFLLSARVDRGAWRGVRFDALDQVDPVAALASHPHRRDMTRTGIFRGITPFSASDLPRG
jgi:hypothetical protein